MLQLYIPKLEDYWYEQKIQSDKDTMSYNAGYDVSYSGYHYDTGCIDFPKEKWLEIYNKRINENRFFAYLKDTNTNKFVGYVNYQYNKDYNTYECGIVIEANKRGKGYAKEGLKLLCEHAKKNGIKSLYDNFEKDRLGIEIFEQLGFKVYEETTWNKFGNIVNGIVVKKDL